MKLLIQRATPRKRIDDNERRRAFASEIYRQELGQYWRPRGLSKGDWLKITRKYERWS